MSNILVISKRQYMKKDLLDDRFGRFREIPLALAARGHHVHGICLSYRQRNEGRFQDGPVQWESVNLGLLVLPGLLRFIRLALLRACRADVIWACSDSIYGILGYFLALKCRIPLVFDLYDNFEYYLMARLPVVKQLYRMVVRKCTAVTCVSGPLARSIQSFRNKHEVLVLENAVRADLFQPLDRDTCRKKLGLPQNALLVGTAGALEKNRGILALLEAFDSLHSRIPSLRLVLAGPRDISIPRSTHIHDLGVVSLQTIPLVLNALDVVVICTLDDAFGRYCFPQKAVEAMACNVPLVASRVGSLAELFSHRPGWLFIPGDSGDLKRVLQMRLQDRTTDYEAVMTWELAAERLNVILERILPQAHGIR
jgi:glycosyltransferase involved in cell wall biosynthesis